MIFIFQIWSLFSIYLVFYANDFDIGYYIIYYIDIKIWKWRFYRKRTKTLQEREDK